MCPEKVDYQAVCRDLLDAIYIAQYLLEIEKDLADVLLHEAADKRAADYLSACGVADSLHQMWREPPNGPPGMPD